MSNIKSVPVPNCCGYPQTDINKAGVMVKGRWPSGTKTIQHGTMRGGGAATKGLKFNLTPEENN